MNLARIFGHLLFTDGRMHRAFSAATLEAIGQSIQASEGTHGGEIRFVVEGGLDGMPLFEGQTASERALALFAQLRVWDTANNNGVLLYVLLADRAVEIIADRGVHLHAGTQAWAAICRQMELAYAQSDFQGGTISGIQAVGQLLRQHYPRLAAGANELPDEPTLLN